MERPDTLAALVDAITASDNRPALMTVRPDGHVDSVARGELVRRAHVAAALLLRSGVESREPIALVGPNSAEWVVAYLAILGACATPVLIDGKAGPQDLARALADSGARRVFTSRPESESQVVFRAARSAVTLLEDLQPSAMQAAGTTGELPGLLPAPRPDDVAALVYTSGTTGAPKGVPLTHRNLLANLRALAETGLLGPHQTIVLPLPLHHTYPFTCGLLGCLMTGATLVFPAGVMGPELITAIRSSRATALLGVPRLYTALLSGIVAKATSGVLGKFAFESLLGFSTALRRRARIRAGRILFASLHRQIGPTLRILVSGGARLDPEVAWRLEGLGWDVLSGYGLTETSPILTFNIPGHVRHETVGRALPGVELRIDTGADQDVGEILARGPNVFAAYRNNPDATRQAFTPDGWFRTGDLGRLDDEGYLHIVGRVKEIIVLPDGKKFVPEDIEQFYAASPFIREAALLEHRGRLVALIVPDDEQIRQRGATRLASLIREQLEALSQRLPAWQRITDYRLLHEPLPRTPMGKLQRFRLAEMFDLAHGVAPAKPCAELTDSDRALLETNPGRNVWTWLHERFPGKPLTLDASPQLDLGVDSLEWVALTLEIRDRFGVELGPDAVARVLTVRDLLQEVAAAAGHVPSAITAPVQAGVPAEPAPALAAALRAGGLVLYALDRLLMRLVFRLRVEGLQHLPARGPLLIAPNHASYLDPLAVAAALPWRLLWRVRWAGWTDYMFRAWHWRLLSRATGVFPVDPDRAPAAAIEAGKAVLARRAVLAWFPEGRRTLTGETGRFLPGIGVLLQHSGSPVVPVRISGSFEALPWHRRWPRRVAITVAFGPPLLGHELQAMGEGTSTAERIASGLRRAVVQLGQRT